MVDVLSKRCLHDFCTKIPSFNVEGSRTSAYCKQHAEDGMVDITSKRCLHDSCTRRPTFNVKGRKTAAFCRKHAEDGMVNVSKRRCSHALCTKRPHFNVEGSKTAVYCKQHADDGMVNVLSKRCSHDSCTKFPSFNVAGLRTPAYCKQHAEDGMVNIVKKRCSHGSCTKQPNFNTVGSKTAVVCKQHAQDGMVNVRITRFSAVSRRAVPGRVVPNNVETSASTAPNTECLDDSGIHVQKRTRSTLDRKKTPHSFGHGPWRGGVVVNAGRSPTNELSHALSFRTFLGEVTDHTVVTAAKQTGHVMSGGLPKLQDKEHSDQFGEAIKAEVELLVLL